MRVLDEQAPEPPAWNMAVDQALLHGDDALTLRLYRWLPAGLSLGRFQDAAAFAAVPGQHALVRRITGGGAIYHADELTWSLTGDAATLPSDLHASYDLVHGAVAAALRDLGIAVHVRAGGASCARGRAAWCFAEPARHDIVIADGRKLVGSAQRRLLRPRPRVLLHGSIPLSPPPHPSGCPGLSEVVAASDDLEARLRRRLTERLAAALRSPPWRGRLGETERRAAAAELAGGPTPRRAGTDA